MILAGIDDTDTLDSPGTNKVARAIVEELLPHYHCQLIVRHQLLFDPRVPYTSKNSSASLWLEPAGDAEHSLADLHARICDALLARFEPGSDPGVCVVNQRDVPDEVIEFGRRCQTDVVNQSTAREIAERHGILLRGLGGTNDGVIGSLAAVGLAATQNDGRVVQINRMPDDLSYVQLVAALRNRGVEEIRCSESNELIETDSIDIGKHLRPNVRNGRIVMYAERSTASGAPGCEWMAVRRL